MLANILPKLRFSSFALRPLGTTAVTDTNKTTESNQTPINERLLRFPTKYQSPRQIWVENLDTIDEQKRGLLELHPSVFAVNPRIDIIYQNMHWQRMYRFVSYAHAKIRSEVRGGGRKPWPQKGLGKARHGSIRSPIWKGGGVAHGPRSPTPHFYMLPFYLRVHGLTSTLSVKFAQDDLHVVEDLEIPTDEPQFIEELVRARNWGPSVLFVDEIDIMPKNITLAMDNIKHFNMMPVYGLNVYSMLKHDTLVLTKAAINKIEEKLILHLNRNDDRRLTQKFKLDSV